MDEHTQKQRSYEAIGNRLYIVRTALGLSQTEFCKRCGVSTTSYNQYERGKHRPTVENALKMCDSFGLTLDYIYAGKAYALPSGLMDMLRAGK